MPLYGISSLLMQCDDIKDDRFMPRLLIIILPVKHPRGEGDSWAVESLSGATVRSAAGPNADPEPCTDRPRDQRGPSWICTLTM